MLNTSKNVALTLEAQPPSFIHVGDSHMINVLGHAESNTWLGCMLCACPGQGSDVEYHLQQAAKAFQKQTHCAISKQLFLQQPASLQSTALYTENIYLKKGNSKVYSSHSGLHRARIGQRNGMIFCTSGICVWITRSVPVECFPGPRSV